MRAIFEKHHDKKLVEHYEQSLSAWQQQRSSLEHALDLARSFNGETSDLLLLKKGEAVFATVTNASLVEERRGAGHYEGRSAGVSVPIGKLGGHEVRYRVGATRGHYQQAPPQPSAVDTGTVVVTNQRVAFIGSRQTRECEFSKLVAAQHEADGTSVLSVSNREKPLVIHYGAQLAGWFRFRFDLAMAHFQGTVDQLIAQLQHQLGEVDAARPQPPPGLS